ncbi:MAG: glycosyltransferase family 39 protein [Candidatus Hydrogenedentes bacterium]|nr:glycosyltransferase family 39 protein [Candidatus Hydrogenedentota bacterium]
MYKTLLPKFPVLDETSLSKGPYRYLAWCIIGFGLLPRLSQFASGRSLWHDESLLSASIVERGFMGLLAPLDHMQIAPPLYLWSLKLCTLLGGYTVYAVRFPSIVVSVAGLILGWHVARRMLSPVGALLGLLLLAASQHLINYAGETKPYSGDAMCTLLVFYLALKWEETPPNGRRTLLFGGILAIAVWMSYPVVFVIAGVGIVQLSRSALNRDKRDFLHLATLCGISAASFLLQLFLVVLPNRADSPMMDFMEDYWKHGFMPFPPKSIFELSWFRVKAFWFFDMPGGFTLQGLALFVFLVGLCALFFRKRHYAAFLLLPLVVALIASGLHLYPFQARLTLFLVPVIMFAVGEGIGWIVATGNRRTGWVSGAVLTVLLMTQPLLRASRVIIAPTRHHELEKAMEYTNAHWQSGDRVFLVYTDSASYRFLSHRYLIPEDAIIAESRASHDEGDRERLLQEMAPLVEEGGPVWFPLTYEYESHIEYILAYLDRHGVRDQEFSARGASAYRYTFPDSGQ